MTKLREPGSPRAVLRALYDQCGGARRAADLLGGSETSLIGATDPDSDRDIGWRRVVLLTRHFRATAAAEHLALAAGGVFLPLDITPGELGRSAGQAVREVADVVERVLSAQADGAVSTSEARDIRREIDEAVAELMRARAAVTAIIEENR
ncbi:phage regulatory CII family protein [Blastochloris tepida]|uniref:Uncharacterized protein n=1 Tax=Blastochloris tepida TaxID=2233851 RepID=A0A348G1C0_9HYPH|nr:phage regulatory CII family protein [Blastochloris tepida]BBF93353.1 hypothetical protein BLTE_20380 [Blastochloris tepida]